MKQNELINSINSSGKLFEELFSKINNIESFLSQKNQNNNNDEMVNALNEVSKMKEICTTLNDVNNFLLGGYNNLYKANKKYSRIIFGSNLDVLKPFNDNKNTKDDDNQDNQDNKDNKDSQDNQDNQDNKPVKIKKPRKEVYTRKAKKNDYIDFSSLHQTHIYHDVECNCADCGGDLTKIDEEIQYKLVPAEQLFTVEVHHYTKKTCSCRDCFDENGKKNIYIAEDSSVLPGSYYSAELLSYIIFQKYFLHLPEYRLEKFFAEMGIPLKRSTMNKKIRMVYQKYLENIVKLIMYQIKKAVILFSDETKVKVTANGNTKSTAFAISVKGKYPFVIYIICKHGDKKTTKELLGDNKIHLHCDKSPIYDLPNITRILCMAHLRRKFTDCSQVEPNEIIDVIVGYINQLYKLEQQFKENNYSANKIKIERQRLSVPILDKMFAYMEEKLKLCPDKSPLKNAILYALNDKESFYEYTKNGEFEISNNVSERFIKVIIMGRKNWNFCFSQKGAEVTGGLLTLINTAKLNGLNSAKYITYLLKELPKRKIGEKSLELELSDLLPWSKKIQENCKN